MRSRFIIPAAAILATGCTSWHAQTSPAPDVVARQHGRGQVRVLRHDGSVLVLRTPEVVGDSIVGVGGNPPRRTAVALADVERIDSRGFSAVKTGGLALGYLTVITLVALGAAMAALFGDWE